jgi:murein DD-endopeptidase MepM/ murein hydrolase activator NlpD
MKATALFVCLFTACTAQFCVDLSSYGCLRLRATASSSGELIACIPDGKYVEDLGSSRWIDGLMWRNIRYNGQSGWAAADYLKHCGGTQPPLESTSGAKIFGRTPFNTSFPIAQFYGDTASARLNQGVFYGATQGMHSGVDWSVAYGTRVYSLCEGIVVHAGMNSPFGAGPRSVIVRCGDWYVLYGHLSGEVVFRGQEIKENHVVGESGLSGSSHMHLEVRPVPDNLKSNWDYNAHPFSPGKAVNPMRFFKDSVIADHFNARLQALGGSKHFCTGSMVSQPDIVFGGHLRSDPCTN